MGLTEKVKQLYYGWKLTRQHNKYLQKSVGDHMLDYLADPTLLDRMDGK